MKTIVGDITTIDRGVIVHQTNCMGIMGGGLAAQIRQKWPHVNEAYVHHCHIARNERWKLLGTVQFIPVSPYLTVANAFGQLDTSSHAAHCATDYLALGECLRTIRKVYDGKLLEVYFPYKIGCGLGGGDWDVVLQLLSTFCPAATLVQLPTTPSTTSEIWGPSAPSLAPQHPLSPWSSPHAEARRP